MAFVSVEVFRKITQAFQSGTSLVVEAGVRPGPAVNSDSFLALVAEIRASVGSPSNADRRVASQRKDAMLAGDFKADLLEVLRKGFKPYTFERLTLTLHTSTNVLADITARLSALYDRPAHRYLKSSETKGAEVAPPSAEELAQRTNAPGPEEPTRGSDPEFEQLLDYLDIGDEADEGDALDDIAKAAALDVVLQKVERFARAHPCVWVRPFVVYDVTLTEGPEGEQVLKEDTATGRVGFTLYTPSNAGVIFRPDAPTEAWAFYYWTDEATGSGGTVSRLNVWTDSAFFVLDNEWKLVGEPQPNPLGRLPVAKFEIDVPVNGYYCEGNGADLYDATLELCVLKTIQNQRAKEAGFKQLAIQGNAKQFPAEQVMGSAVPLILGEGNSATVLDLQPALEQWTELCRNRAEEIRARYGITPDAEAGSGGTESGYAKRLKLMAVERESKRTRPHFARGERDLWALLARLAEVRPSPVLGTVPTGDLVVDFAEFQIDENPKEQAETDARELKLHTVSIVDVVRRKNPDLSERECARLAFRNRMINERLLPAEGERLVDFLAMGAKGEPLPGEAGAAPVPGAEPLPGDPALSTPGAPFGAEKAQDTALNGAQVTAAADITQRVVDGQLPYETGLQMLQTFFNLTPEQAEAILKPTKSFKPKPPPAPPKGAFPNASPKPAAPAPFGAKPGAPPFGGGNRRPPKR